MRLKLLIFLVALFVPPVNPASASESGSVRGLLADHCIDCHRVPGFAEEAAAPQIGAPDFQSIADDPTTYTTERLARFLRQPHFPMRRFVLSERDIQRLVAFIEGLRSGPASAQ